MTLSERMARCRMPDCKRAPAYPDQAYCAEHRVKWQPEWRKRATAKDMTHWEPSL